MKVDTTKMELHNRWSSTSGKKTELSERLKNTMANRIPLVVESKTSLTLNGFSPTARWALLSSTEDAEELVNVDSTFFILQKRVATGTKAFMMAVQIQIVRDLKRSHLL